MMAFIELWQGGTLVSHQPVELDAGGCGIAELPDGRKVPVSSGEPVDVGECRRDDQALGHRKGQVDADVRVGQDRYSVR